MDWESIRSSDIGTAVDTCECIAGSYDDSDHGNAWSGAVAHVVNPATQSLAIYRFEPNNPRGALKLEAVRQFRWDMMLSEYQNQPPEVSAVESMTRGKR